MIYCATSDGEGKRVVRFLNGTYNKPFSGLTDIYKYWDNQVGEVAPAYADGSKAELLPNANGNDAKMMGRKDLYDDYLPPVVGEIYLLMKSDTKYYDKYRLAIRGITESSLVYNSAPEGTDFTNMYAASNACNIGRAYGGHQTTVSHGTSPGSAPPSKAIMLPRYGAKYMSLVETDGSQAGGYRNYSGILKKPSRGHNVTGTLNPTGSSFNKVRVNQGYGAIQSDPLYGGTNLNASGVDAHNICSFIVRDFHTSWGDSFDALFVISQSSSASITILNLRDGNWFNFALPSTMDKFRGVYVPGVNKVYLFQKLTTASGKVQIIDCATGLASEVTGKSIACGGNFPSELAVCTDGTTIVGHDNGVTAFKYDTTTNTGTNYANTPSSSFIMPRAHDTYRAADGNPRGNEVVWVCAGSAETLIYNEDTDSWSFMTGVSSGDATRICIYIDKRTGKCYMPASCSSTMYIGDLVNGGYTTFNIGVSAWWLNISPIGFAFRYQAAGQKVFACFAYSENRIFYYNIDTNSIYNITSPDTGLLECETLPTTGKRIFTPNTQNRNHLFRNYDSENVDFNYLVAGKAYATSDPGTGAFALWTFHGNYGMSLAHHLYKLTGNSFWFHRYLERSYKNQLY